MYRCLLSASVCQVVEKQDHFYVKWGINSETCCHCGRQADSVPYLLWHFSVSRAFLGQLINGIRVCFLHFKGGEKFWMLRVPPCPLNHLCLWYWAQKLKKKLGARTSMKEWAINNWTRFKGSKYGSHSLDRTPVILHCVQCGTEYGTKLLLGNSSVRWNLIKGKEEFNPLHLTYNLSKVHNNDHI